MPQRPRAASFYNPSILLSLCGDEAAISAGEVVAEPPPPSLGTTAGVRHNRLTMNTATELERHSQNLLAGLAREVSAPALDQLVANVTHALAASLAQGDRITVSGLDQRLTTRRQVLNALNQGARSRSPRPLSCWSGVSLPSPAGIAQMHDIRLSCRHDGRRENRRDRGPVAGSGQPFRPSWKHAAQSVERLDFPFRSHRGRSRRAAPGGADRRRQSENIRRPGAEA